MYENREKKMSGAKQQAREKPFAISSACRRSRTSAYCMDAPDKPKHLHVAYGNSVPHAPADGTSRPRHCIIAPIAHTQSSTG